MPSSGVVSGQTAIVRALREHLPLSSVLFNEEDVRPYECDAWTMARRLPMVVALPDSETQIRAVLAVCQRFSVPVVPRGAGTGLSGGALPHASGVLMGLAKLNRILNIDTAQSMAVVQPGVRNLALSEAAAPYGLYYAPDPSSQIACTIGGNIAENSGGVHCLKYGLTLHNVIKLRALNIRGEVLELSGAGGDAPGLDLLPLMVGSEGMLAIVTEATVKLLPRPAAAQVILASFSTVEAAADAVATLIGAGVVPAGLEMMDQRAVRMVEPFVQAGYDTEAAAVLLCESDGTVEEVAEEVPRMCALLRAAGASSLSVSADSEHRARLWAGRKNAFPAAGRISPDYYCMDGTIPRGRLAEVLRAIQEMEKRYDLRCANVFHAGDGNLHPLILFDGDDAEQLQRAEAFGVEILELCVAVGGTITGEHGVGLEKIDQMCTQFSEAEREIFQGIKQAFDPDGLLNPEKVIPSLHRCAEYGRMRVRRGQLPFADIPRF